MPAPEGNKFWEARSSHGRKPIYDDPDKLMDACTQYFQWVEDNPLWESKVFHSQGDLTEATLPKMRAMTISGLCRFIGVSLNTWITYRENDDFSHIAREVDEIIREQKLTGAAADLLNANIIARDLGLREKVDSKHSGDIALTGLPTDELYDLFKRLNQEIVS